MRATSAGCGGQDGPPCGERHDRRDPEVADGDPHRGERADHPDPGGGRIEPDLLGRFAERGRPVVDVVGLGLAAREAHLPAVEAVVGRPLGEDESRLTVGAGEDEDEHRRPPGARPGCRDAAAAGRR